MQVKRLYMLSLEPDQHWCGECFYNCSPSQRSFKGCDVKCFVKSFHIKLGKQFLYSQSCNRSGPLPNCCHRVWRRILLSDLLQPQCLWSWRLQRREPAGLEMDWFHCNRCFTSRGSKFAVSTCGHIYCETCINSSKTTAYWANLKFNVVWQDLHPSLLISCIFGNLSY